MSAPVPQPSGDGSLIAAILLVAVLCLAHAASHRGEAAATGSREAAERSASRGQARDIDEERVRRLILEGRLSGREADHYRVLEPEVPPAAMGSATTP